MGGANDDFIDALNYQVKEEVVRNYLEERLILEEEIKEYNQLFDQYKMVEAEARRRRDELICLLVGPENFRKFFRILGFAQPPLVRRLGSEDFITGAPFCPLGLTPKGIMKKSRYLDLTLKTYELFALSVHEAGEKAKQLTALGVEINEDIATFHNNYDLLSIIGFLRNLDYSMQLKKKFLGDNFTGQMEDVEKRMRFKKLDPSAQGIRPWPELPTADEARRKTEKILNEIFQKEREAILPALVKT